MIFFWCVNRKQNVILVLLAFMFCIIGFIINISDGKTIKCSKKLSLSSNSFNKFINARTYMPSPLLIISDDLSEPVSKILVVEMATSLTVL